MDELAPIKKSRVPTSKWTLYHAMRCILRECFGDFFKGTDEIVRMKDNFDFVSSNWYEHKIQYSLQTMRANVSLLSRINCM